MRGLDGRRQVIGSLRRLAGVAATAAICLTLAPGTASAAPVNPSNSSISSAKDAASEASAKLQALVSTLADAEAAVTAAEAAADIALGEYQDTAEAYGKATKAADKATAVRKQAEDELATAKANLVAFARDSYMQGTTDPSIVALTSADGPAQLLERAALLEAAGKHQGDVVTAVTTAEKKAAQADETAQQALATAADLKKKAAAQLASAEAVKADAAQQAASLRSEKSTLNTELAQAKQRVATLVGERAAAQQYAAAQAAVTASSEAVSSGGYSGPSAGSGSSSAVETAISAAKRYLGTIYAWGGGSTTGPSVGWGVDAGVVGFDCSGLTRYAYAQAGITIPRNSAAQYAALAKVSRSDLQRGDLVFYATNTSNAATIHHVALYLGNGQIIEAPQSGSVIRITSMRWGGYIGAVRPSA